MSKRTSVYEAESKDFPPHVLLLLHLLQFYPHPLSSSVDVSNVKPALRVSGGCRGLQKVISMWQRKSLAKWKKPRLVYCLLFLLPPFAPFLLYLSGLTRLAGPNTHWHFASACLQVDWHHTPGTASPPLWCARFKCHSFRFHDISVENNKKCHSENQFKWFGGWQTACCLS